MHDQVVILRNIIQANKGCVYGERYHFGHIERYEDWVREVPLVEYADLESYIQQMLEGHSNILCTEHVPYFARTAGTSGKNKYIPVTKSCLKYNHMASGKEFMSGFLRQHPYSSLFQGKSLIMGWGFFEQESNDEYIVWFISAILQKEAGRIGSLFREPPEEIAYLHNRDTKVKKIIERTIDADITSMGGVTSRCLLLLEKILKISWKNTMLDVRPNFQLFISGGVNFEPYRPLFERLFPGPQVSLYQVYNASEWFIAWQLTDNNTDMVLYANHGIFLEFINMETYYTGNKEVVMLDKVECWKSYAIVLTTWGGLYRYVLGDVIQFTDLDQWLCKIIWRTKVCIDVFGEYLMVGHADEAVKMASKETNCIVTDYTVAPIFMQEGTKWQHERIIECKPLPNDEKKFVNILDTELQKQTSYYAGKRKDDAMILKPMVHFVQPWFFYKRFESTGRLGGQSKVKKLSNSRELIDQLLAMI